MVNIQIQNDSYKTLHEDFVSHNNGTTPSELVVVVLPWLVTTFIMQLVQSSKIVCFESQILQALIEFLFTAIPTLMVLTVCSDYIPQLVVVLLIICASVITLKVALTCFRGSDTWPENVLDSIVVSPESSQFTFLGNCRTHLCILTCISILAIDFPIYPRRFAKTETFGYGLMDTGVGFFMIVNGYVAPEARKKFDFAKSSQALKKSLLSSIPLLVLGVVRVISVKALNYQEHVTEYGVHWNFFFSLASAKIGCSLVFMFFPPVASGLVAVVLAGCYQIFLHLGLRDIVFYGIDGKDSRSNFIDANREGLASCIGFTCLYLTGVQFGYLIFRTGLTLRSWLKRTATIFVIVGVLTFALGLSHFYIEPASRRLVNLTYILWLTSFMYFLTVCWMCVDLVDVVLKLFCGPPENKFVATKPPLVSASISYNFLLAFLIANVLTGIVNMSMATIFASKYTSLAVLTGYTFVLCAVIVICYEKKLQLKFF